MSHHRPRHPADKRQKREIEQMERKLMSVSREVQTALDEIKRNKSLADSTAAADKLRDQKIKDQQAAIDDLNAKIAAIPVNQEMSQEDKDALTQGAADLKASGDELEAINSQLQTAVPANTPGPAAADNQSGIGQASAGQSAPVQTGPGSSADGAAPIDGPTAADGGAQVPLMPNSAFDPAGGVKPPAATDGQPQQPAAIETAGGFVIAGGGSTARAPGSMPDSPSSSLVVPLDPDAKGPSSNADVIKSGLGDSSQNALLGNDGQPIEDGPGIPKPPSDAAVQREQDRQDALAAEQQARRDNPLNLAPAGTPQAGSPEAEKAAQQRRDDEQRQAQADQQARNDAEQGKPAPGTPGPDPVSAPTTPPAASPAP